MDGIYGPDEVLYDQLRLEGVYCQPGMDAHAEFVEGVPKEKRRIISSKDPHAKRLDEWAHDYGISVSKLIERIANAVCVTKRRDKAQRELERYREQVEPEPLIKEETMDEGPVGQIVTPICPTCGKAMKLRKSSWGEFWGCSSYPRCKGKLTLKQGTRQAEEGPPVIQTPLATAQKPPQEPPWIPAKIGGWFKGFRKWIIIGSLAFSLMGLVGFAEFMYEEALQQTGFGGFMLKSAGLAKEAYDLCEVYERRIDRMARFTYALGWLSPFNWGAYRMYIDSARTNVQSLRMWAIAREPALAMVSNGPLPTVASVLDRGSWADPATLFNLEGVVDYQDVERHVGQTVKVLMPILGVERMDTVALAVSDSSFLVVCFPSSEIVWRAFPSLASTWAVIEGKVQMYNGVPEIIVSDWSQIKETKGLRD